jgi:hypothetical protein
VGKSATPHAPYLLQPTTSAGRSSPDSHFTGAKNSPDSSRLQHPKREVQTILSPKR